MWKCKTCGCENPDTYTSCRMCKEPAPNAASQPHFTKKQPVRFCGKCGRPIEQGQTSCRYCATKGGAVHTNPAPIQKSKSPIIAILAVASAVVILLVLLLQTSKVEMGLQATIIPTSTQPATIEARPAQTALSVNTLLSAGEDHTVGLLPNGTVMATGYNDYGQCNVSEWQEIIAISAGYSHTVGLKADGTVVATGDNSSGQCNVYGWQNIVAVAAGGCHTVGLKADGTVVVESDYFEQSMVSGWRDVVAISAKELNIVALKANGTVVAVSDFDTGQCNVSGWKDIVAISAGNYHTVGLKADGTVVAVGFNEGGQCNVANWTNIIAVSAGESHTVGLKADGTVVAAGDNYKGQCNVSEWHDIVAVSAGYAHTVGLKSDGTVVATGSNLNGKCNVSSWNLFTADNLNAQQSVDPYCVHPDPVIRTLGYNQYYQCTVKDFELDDPISEGDVTWSSINGGAVLTCDWRGYVEAGNVQVSPQQGYTMVTVRGTTSNGSVLQYNFQVGDGQTYNIYRSSKVLEMKRGKHYPYLCNPGIEDCLGFTMKFSYNVSGGNYVKNIWSVWIRVNGDEWTEVGEITVNEGEQKEYVIRFNRAYTFTEIAVQHPIDYNNYTFTDSLSVSNIIHGW